MSDALIALRKAQVLLHDIAAHLAASDQIERAEQCLDVARRCSLDADLLGG